MYWTDIAAIVFTCVTVNHLGLVSAIEGVTRKELPIVNCPRCLTFWSVLAYGLARLLTGLSGDGIPAALPSVLPRLLAISLLSSYLAIWLEFLEGYIDVIYLKAYEQVYPATDPADADEERA